MDRWIAYKSIASGFPRLSVSNNNSFLDVSEQLKVFPEAGVGGVIRKTSDEDLGVCGVLLRAVHPHDDLNRLKLSLRLRKPITTRIAGRQQ